MFKFVLISFPWCFLQAVYEEDFDDEDAMLEEEEYDVDSDFPEEEGDFSSPLQAQHSSGIHDDVDVDDDGMGTRDDVDDVEPPPLTINVSSAMKKRAQQVKKGNAGKTSNCYNFRLLKLEADNFKRACF